MTQSESAAPEPGRYTAVVHFHGMGSQRRLEETSRMIDALDSYQYAEFNAGRPIGYFRDIEPRLIKPETVGSEPDAYIRAYFVRSKDAPWQNLRFHVTDCNNRLGMANPH